MTFIIFGVRYSSKRRSERTIHIIIYGKQCPKVSKALKELEQRKPYVTELFFEHIIKTELPTHTTEIGGEWEEKTEIEIVVGAKGGRAGLRIKKILEKSLSQPNSIKDSTVDIKVTKSI